MKKKKKKSTWKPVKEKILSLEAAVGVVDCPWLSLDNQMENVKSPERTEGLYALILLCQA